MRKVFLFPLILASILCMSAYHKRDGARLPPKEKEFAAQLSVRQRRVFCGRFNHVQRELAIKHAKGRGRDKCFTPDEAVTKVMEETGMPLAVKSRRETE